MITTSRRRSPHPWTAQSGKRKGSGGSSMEQAKAGIPTERDRKGRFTTSGDVCGLDANLLCVLALIPVAVELGRLGLARGRAMASAKQSVTTVAAWCISPRHAPLTQSTAAISSSMPCRCIASATSGRPRQVPARATPAKSIFPVDFVYATARPADVRPVGNPPEHLIRATAAALPFGCLGAAGAPADEISGHSPGNPASPARLQGVGLACGLSGESNRSLASH